MEAFKERLIQEYNELNERIGKLDNFFTHLSDDDVSKEMVEIMGKQLEVMKEYSNLLHKRMRLLCITEEDVINFNHPYQSLPFGEALQALEAGKCVTRESWIGDKFVVKQIDSDIPAEVVPKMQSIPAVLNSSSERQPTGIFIIVTSV